MKKNIAIIVPRLTGGGAERVASNLSLYLSNEYEKYIIVYHAEKIDYPYKGKLINLNTKAASNIIGKMINFVKRVYKIRKIKKQHHIETTISFMEGPNIVNIFSKYKDQVILSVHTFISKREDNFYSKVYKKLIKMFYNMADVIVVVSESIKKDLIKNYQLKKEKLRVIYNPMDIQAIQLMAKQEIEEKYSEIFSHPVMINVGRCIKAKGQWHLIRVFKKVKEKIPDIKLVILGEGELKEYLENLVKELKLEEDVYFLGFQKNPFQYISRSIVYVFPSLFEGFPNALPEAMACGLPVIAADCKSGPREILAPNTNIEMETQTIQYTQYGILVPVCDGNFYSAYDPLTEKELVLVNSITNLVRDKDLSEKYAQYGRQRVQAFNIDRIIAKWIDII
ncbi:glycosyltransferase [Clostridiaceae bacterium 35-E11]